MVAYKNFYETLQEARMRLRNTVVQYDEDFYWVYEVSDHKQDGKFRVYLDELGKGDAGRNIHPGLPSVNDFHHNGVGDALDKWIEKNPEAGFLRKYADSRHFKKFRPFPLGNVNFGGSILYTERTPTRNMHQGLLPEAVLATKVQSVPKQRDPHGRRTSSIYHQGLLGDQHVNVFGAEFYNMLTNNYPDYREVVQNLRDPSILNEGCAFHREYSVMRGPLDMLFLCYKHQGVGLVDADENVTIGSNHEFLKEEIAELGVFNSLTIKEVKSDA